MLQINLRLILVSNKSKEFVFSPTDSAGDIALHVYDNWPEGEIIHKLSTINFDDKYLVEWRSNLVLLVVNSIVIFDMCFTICTYKCHLIEWDWYSCITKERKVKGSGWKKHVWWIIQIRHAWWNLKSMHPCSSGSTAIEMGHVNDHIDNSKSIAANALVSWKPVVWLNKTKVEVVTNRL